MTFGFKQGAVYVTDAATSRTNLGITNVATQSVTQHDLLIGGAANAITSVAPSATSGVPVISQGASSDPAFGTAVVAGGGTGATSLNINGPVISNTTTTGALAAVTLTSQQFLVGNAAAPTAKTFSVVRQVFTSTGTYTPTSGMVDCDMECVGGGGGGGSASATGAGQLSVGGGGGSGEYARGIFSAATIGASKTVTIGAAGTAGTAGGAGGNGGTSSVGSTLISSGGGTGGGASGGAPHIGGDMYPGGAGGTGGTGGDFRVQGAPGGWGISLAFAALAFGLPGGGYGGSSYFGGGALAVGTINTSSAGNAATGYGGGGGGAANLTSEGSARDGGAGVKGVVIITEYVIA